MNHPDDRNLSLPPYLDDSQTPLKLSDYQGSHSQEEAWLNEAPDQEDDDSVFVSAVKGKAKRPKRSWFLRFTAYVVILTFVSGFTFGAGYLTANLTGGLPILNNKQSSGSLVDEGMKITQVQSVVTNDAQGSTIATIANDVSPAIVTISAFSEQVQQGFFGSYSGIIGGTGSGIIFKVDEDQLYVVTNYHVIENADTIEVIFNDGSKIGAKALGFSSKTDIAVLALPLNEVKQHIDNLVVASFGDSEKVQVGELAIAIGNPLGPEYALTVTAGIISALGRDIYIDQNTTAVNLIQTDAAINPGNSGGALLNGQGQVIGINSAKYVDTSVEGIGFAIPVNDAREVIDQILESQDGSDVSFALADDRAFLGVEISDITSEIYAETGMRFGVYIKGVYPSSGAEEAGITEGDVIYSINNRRIENVQALFNALENAKVGDTLEIGLIRGDEIITAQAPLYSYKDVMDKQDQ